MPNPTRSDDDISRPSEVVRVDPDHPDPGIVQRAGRLLTEGHLVAFPTETVYGLGAHAFDVDAVRAVFRGKGRPATDPLIVHVGDTSQLPEVVSQFPPEATALATRFWPGPLTLVLPRTSAVPDVITAGRDTVAVRVPAHPVTQAVLVAAGVPIAAPSANRFGRISPTTAQHVVAELHGVYDLLLDAGPTPLGLESTVVDLSGPVPVLLRPGGVTLEELRETLGTVEFRERDTTDESVDAAAPGQFVRHYAPTTPLVLVDGGPGLVSDLLAALESRGVSVAVVGSAAADSPATTGTSRGSGEAGPVSEATAAARDLYSLLRAADGRGMDLLLAAPIDPSGLGRAVNDRLFRAAHGRIVRDTSEATIDGLVALGDAG